MPLALLLAAVASLAQAQPAQSAADRQELAEELRAEIDAFRTSLPIRDGVLTISRVDLRGIEIVYTGTVAADFDAAAIARFRQALREGLCTKGTREVIRRGGAFTYDLRDQTGEHFVTTVDNCG